MVDDRFNTWNKWIDVIRSEITRLSIDRNIFWEVQDIIKNNPKIQKPSSFYDFLRNTYAASALMGVRRQVKIDKDSISFAKLLREICDNPEILSRTRYFAHYKGSSVEEIAKRLGTTVEKYRSQDFDQFAVKAGDHVDPELIKLDLEKLKSKAQKCEKYADQRVAHFDKKAISIIPRFTDLDSCIDYLEILIKKYYLLFRASVLTRILPESQNEYDWKAIFKEAWIP
jgi:predicted Zn-dependent protease